MKSDLIHTGCWHALVFSSASKVKGEGRNKSQLNRNEKSSVPNVLGPKKTTYTGTLEHSTGISDTGNMPCK